ncbi:hypothetical protein GCM10025858_21110 [Alicyclobacillus sacchari]|nr:hypothetical protein GCM10025858_21110 [Alicyclobacillus sacchari]
MLNRLSLLQAQRQSLVATLNSLSEQTAVKQGVKKGSAQVDVNAALLGTKRAELPSVARGRCAREQGQLGERVSDG